MSAHVDARLRIATTNGIIEYDNEYSWQDGYKTAYWTVRRDVFFVSKWQKIVQERWQEGGSMAWNCYRSSKVAQVCCGKTGGQQNPVTLKLTLNKYDHALYHLTHE